jgi:hypothetical protein
MQVMDLLEVDPNRLRARCVILIVHELLLAVPFSIQQC